MSTILEIISSDPSTLTEDDKQDLIGYFKTYLMTPSRRIENPLFPLFKEILDRFPDYMLEAINQLGADKCFNCDAQLYPCLGSHIYDLVSAVENFQFENALQIKLIGGYGMYFDSLDSANPEFVLCHDCAEKFFNLFPGLKDALDL